MINITRSQSEYLKAIYVVSHNEKVTITKIADFLGYKKPSVIKALKSLNDLCLINYTHELIELTEQGLVYIKNLNRRYDVLQKFFVDILKINPELAKKDAENIRCSVSCYTITQLEKYLREVLNIDLNEYKDYCICNFKKDKCDNCK